MAYREQAAALNVGALLALALAYPLAVLAVEPGMAVPTSVGLALAALALLSLVAFAAWRDTVLFCKHAFTASLFGLGACGLGWLLSGPDEKPVLITCLTGGAALALLLVQHWLQRRRGHLPHVLLSTPELSPVVEYEGIHLALDGRWAVAPGRTSTVGILLENCWDGPREVTVELRVEQGPAGPPLKCVQRLSCRLEGAEVRRAGFQVQAPPGVQGTYTLLAHVTVRGVRGRRVRARRAQEFQNQVSTTTQAAYLLAGAFIWGGGLRLCVLAESGGTLTPEPWSDGVAWQRVWPLSDSAGTALAGS